MAHRSDDPVPSAPGPEYLLEVWQRRKWLALLVSSAIAAGAVSLVASLPNLYRATATVLVERQQVSEAFVRPSVTAELETRIQTINQRVMSRNRMTETIARFGLYPEWRDVVPMEALVERLRRELQLTLRSTPEPSGRNSTIAFTIGLTGRDPHTVAQVVNGVAALYVEENARSREQQAARTAAFLKDQLDDVKRDRDHRERRMSQFSVQHAGELQQQVEANLVTLERLNTQLRLNGEYQIRAMERREQLRRQLADSPAGVPAPTPTDSPLSQLRKAQLELGDLRRRFSEDYPSVIRLKSEVAALEQEVARSPEDSDGGANGPDTASETSVARQTLTEVDDELASLRKAEAFLRQTIAGYEGRVENAPKRQEELEQLSRDYTAANERFQTIQKRYEDAELAESLEQGHDVEQFRILDQALAPDRPMAPNRLWLFAVGIVGALAAGLAAIVIAEKLDTTFYAVEELRAFIQVPVLATIGRVRTARAIRRQRVRVALLAIAALIALAGIAAAGYYVGANNEQIVRMTLR